MKARWRIDIAEEAVLRREPSELPVVVPGPGVVEVCLPIEDVAGKPEPIRRRVQLCREAVLPPRIQVVARNGASRAVGQVGDGAEGIEAVEAGPCVPGLADQPVAAVVVLRQL